jgi:DNA sulfur modification protein DndB
MKIPAIKSRIGDWDYYITTLTFEQVSNKVSRIDEQLHQSDSLNDLIQRSITSNFLKIKEYILHQPELFFNSLVLAVYDNYPNWEEVVMKYGEEEYYSMGFLDFPGEHKIFPVDGQHRVEGIKAALIENPELCTQKIGAIFIGHKNDHEGKERTRRLFTTLNRYAKPVSLDDIIALDEDDVVAITTRILLEEYDLFSSNRIIYAKQKSIPPNNKNAITSIITLYQANRELVKTYYHTKFNKKPTKERIDDFLKFRPHLDIYQEYIAFVTSFWDAFKNGLAFVQNYLQTDVDAAEQYRNTEGGNLVFRPIGLLPLVQACIAISERTHASFDDIFARFNNVNFQLSSRPWLYVLWNPLEGKMLMGSPSLTFLMLIYLYGDGVLTPIEMQKLRTEYASKIAAEGDIDNVLDGLRD